MIAIKAAMVAGLKQQMEIIMAQIGSFTRGEDGVFAGTILTLSDKRSGCPDPDAQSEGLRLRRTE